VVGHEREFLLNLTSFSEIQGFLADKEKKGRSKAENSRNQRKKNSKNNKQVRKDITG